MRDHHTTAAPVRQTEISPSERAKLAAMLALAEADQNPADAERLAALSAAERLLSKRGLRLRDLATMAVAGKRLPERGTWRETCRQCLARPGSLRSWELGFLRDLPGFSRLSAKQRYILTVIADRVLGRERDR